MKKLLIAIILLSGMRSFAQPNCQAYLAVGDSLKYKACEVAKARLSHYQFSKYYQQALDKALAIDSTFAFAYRAKSTAYLKSGDFLTWMQLMNKAVQYDTLGHLEYRAWCRYQFFRDYQGAIDDIELLDRLIDYDIGYSVNGDYHLHIARALSYKALGNREKALTIMEEQFEEDFPGPYDYLHLGVLYLELGQNEKAISALKEQEAYNDLAENRYYLGLALVKSGDLEGAIQNLALAKSKYLEEYKMFDPYVQVMDEIYLEDIESALDNL